jgi:hypothetical protein
MSILDKAAQALFDQLSIISDKDLPAKELEQEIKRSDAMAKLQAATNQRKKITRGKKVINKLSAG